MSKQVDLFYGRRNKEKDGGGRITSSFDLTEKNKIPPFRFIGSKHRFLNNLVDVMKKEGIEGETFFDVFCGSCAVSRLLKKSFSIISNDFLYFSYALQRALIVLNEYPKFESVGINTLSRKPETRIKQVLEFLNECDENEGFIYRYYTPASKKYDEYERMYFSEENGKKIDTIRTKIEEWFNKKEINEDEYYYLIASLLMAVQKVSNISGTYGAYNKKWDPRAKKSLTLKPIEIIPSKYEHKAFNKNSYNLLDKIDCDVAYIDPPYNSRQYISNYHLLETIAKYDNPKISGKTGMRDYSEQKKSDLCSKRKVQSSLSQLLSGLNTKHVILSYNSEGLLSKEKINEIFNRTKFKEVELYEYPFPRFKSNKNTDDNAVKEYIFVGRSG